MRNVWILALAQGLCSCSTIILITFGGIVGTRIAPFAALATLPLSLSIVGVALTTVPAALAMQRFGRRRMFTLNALMAGAAALVCAWGVAHAAFATFCVGSLLLGANMAFVQQYRFAAAEYVDASETAKAISAVMLGTLLAAFLGPELGDRLRYAGGWPEFTGSFVDVAGLLVAAAGALLALGTPHSHATTSTGPGRPLREIARQPAFLVAVLASVSSYAVMSFIMTATPISMHVLDGLSVASTKQVITSHLLAMYLPSLVSGWLVTRLGIPRMMMLGVACMGACVAVATIFGHALMHYFSALVVLGLGWNLLFVAGTTLLTRTYTPAERFRAQGCNDFATFAFQAIASLAAGASIEIFGWRDLNLASVPLLALMLASIFVWQRGSNRRETP